MSEVLSAEGEVIDRNAVRFQRLLPGPIERVWEYLTDSDKRGTWLAKGPMELRAGGKAKLRFNHMELSPHKVPPPDGNKKYDGTIEVVWRVTECKAPHLLTLVWGETEKDSEVTFELMPCGDGVLLTVTHRRLADRAFLQTVTAGWHTHLEILADVMNGRTPEAFWATHGKWKAAYERRIAD